MAERVKINLQVRNKDRLVEEIAAQDGIIWNESR